MCACVMQVFEDMLQGLDILVDADMPLACHMRLLVASQLLALMTDLHDLGVEQVGVLHTRHVSHTYTGTCATLTNATDSHTAAS